MISVLFQNDKFVAVDKPVGTSVHDNTDSHALLSVMEAQLKVSKLFPVHRLDKETSGVQILALNSESARELANEFQKKSVTKLYQGILRGQLGTKSGVWNQPLTDKAEGRKNPAGISKHRVACETRYTVIKNSKYFTHCEFNLITGRQHQIRKHTALTNHALVGDPRYGDQKYNAKMAALYKTDRLFLHCYRVEILGQVFESPTPEEFKLLFAQ